MGERTFVPLADGTRLAVTLYRPVTDEPVAVILEALPYRKDDLTSSYESEYLRLRDEFGYAVARVDLRGTGSSDGIALDEYLAQEQQDLCEVIAWLAAQPWCSGSVGMYGTSYSGFNSIQVAAERPPALKAIVAIYATDDRYTDDVHYMGGALRLLDIVDYPLYMAAMNALPPVPVLVGDGWRERWRERMEQLEPWLIRWVEEQRDGPYWRHGSLRPSYDRIACPTMLVAGWADGYRNNTFRTIAALRDAGVPHRLLLGPWSHMAPATSLPGPHVDLVPEMARWWDRWLRERPNGVDDEPPVAVFMQYSTRPGAKRPTVDGEWRSELGWPLVRAQPLTWRLGEGTRSYDVKPDVGTAAWNSCAAGLPWGQPTDQRYDDADSLTWERPADDLELLGHPRLRLRVSCDRPVAFLSAKLCDVFSDGTSSLLSRGLLNLTHRDSHTEPEPLPIGQAVDVEVELEAMSWVAADGHRLRLSLAGTDWPNVLAPPQPVTLTVDEAQSWVVLPALSGSSPTPPPTLAPAPQAVKSGSDPAEGVTWRVEHDVLAGTTACVVDHGSEYDVADGRVREHYDGRVQVHTETFVQHVQASADFTIRWPEATVLTRADLSLRVDDTAYDLVLTVDAEENGAPFARRRWEQRIPRDLG